LTWDELIDDLECNYYLAHRYYSVRMDGEFYELSAGNDFEELEDAKNRALLIKNMYPKSRVTINLAFEIELFEYDLDDSFIDILRA